MKKTSPLVLTFAFLIPCLFLSNAVDACCCCSDNGSDADEKRGTASEPLLPGGADKGVVYTPGNESMFTDLNASRTSVQASPGSPVRRGRAASMIASPDIRGHFGEGKGGGPHTPGLHGASTRVVGPVSPPSDGSGGAGHDARSPVPFPQLGTAPHQQRMGGLSRAHSDSEVSHYSATGAANGDNDVTVGYGEGLPIGQRVITPGIGSLSHFAAPAAAPAPAPAPGDAYAVSAHLVAAHAGSFAVGRHAHSQKFPLRRAASFNVLTPTQEVDSPASTMHSGSRDRAYSDSSHVHSVKKSSPVRGAGGFDHVDSVPRDETVIWPADPMIWGGCKEPTWLEVVIDKFKGVLNIFEIGNADSVDSGAGSLARPAEIDWGTLEVDLNRLETEFWQNPNTFASSLIGMMGFRDGDRSGEFLQQLFSIPENAAWLMYYTQKKPKLTDLPGKKVMLYGKDRALEAVEVDLYKTKDYEALASGSVFALFGNFLSLDAIHGEFKRKFLFDNISSDEHTNKALKRLEEMVREAEQEKIGRATAGVVVSKELAGLELGEDDEELEAHTRMMLKFKAFGFDPAHHVNSTDRSFDPQALFNDSLDEQLSSLIDLVNGYRFLQYLKSSGRSDVAGDSSFSSLFYPDTKGHYMTLEEGLSHLSSGYPNLKGLYVLDSEKDESFEAVAYEMDPSLSGLDFSDTMMFAGGGAEGSTVSAACSVRAYSTSGKTTRSAQTSQTLQTDGVMIKSLNLHDTPIGKIRAFLSSKRLDPERVLAGYISYKQFRDYLEGSMSVSLARVTLEPTLEDESLGAVGSPAAGLTVSHGSVVGLGLNGGDEEYPERYEYFVRALDEESMRAIQTSAKSVVSSLEGLVFFYEILTEPFLKSYLSLAGVRVSKNSITLRKGVLDMSSDSYADIIKIDIGGGGIILDINVDKNKNIARALPQLLRSMQTTFR